MKKFNIFGIFFIVTILFTGCSIKQEIKPVTNIDKRNDVCILENLSVKPGFLQAMRLELHNKGYKSKIIPISSNLDECPTTSTYIGQWSWDLALYLSYANIKVYKNGELSGEAIYDSTKGGANMNKFVKGENKIRELVNLLFP